MEWINKRKRFKAICGALGYSLISIGILGFTVHALWSVPVKSLPPPLPVFKLGDDIMKQSPSEMDPVLLEELKAQYLYDAVMMKKLNTGDRLLRLAVGRTSVYWQPLLTELKALGVDSLLFWKEAEAVPNYRIVYLGPLPPDASRAKFIKKYGLKLSTLGISRAGIEKIVELAPDGKKPTVLMHFEAGTFKP